MNNKYEVVIGLEVHSQIKTETKVFCNCSTDFHSQPNTNICPVCTGQPGVLPVLNKKAVELLVKTAIALDCNINKKSVFARKQYFYPDLPKNYQISQYELPFAEHGNLNISVDDQIKNIGITRIHLEEDAGKLLHDIGARQLDCSLADYNRTGIPLMEIVSEPDMRSPQEAAAYLTALKNLIEYIETSDCNMEEGKFRCDANISIRPVGQKEFGTKAELKNMNTISGVEEALTYEVQRQIEVVENGGKIIQETRTWDPNEKITKSMRSKENAHDYRYFPDPDLVPVNLDDNFINDIKANIPELPEKRKQRLIQEYGLTEYDANVIISDKALVNYYETAVNYASKEVESTAKLIANWLTTELLGKLNNAKLTIKESPVKAEYLGQLVALISKDTISGKIAKIVFEEMFNTNKDPQTIIKEKGLVQISDENEIIKICQEAIDESPKIVAEYKGGKERAVVAIVGLVMKKSRGKANPQMVNKILIDLLKK
ncbi:MAG: Asp-tRNA(Asn)/Glu-tRNA(Gln) amidotransferase subunit GatB [Endomicrobiia bacterium]